jgi:hypothetical protein
MRRIMIWMGLSGFLCLAAALSVAEETKPLSPESRVILIRTLGSEYITLKVPLPVNKKGLEINGSGEFDWQKNEKELAQAPTFLTSGSSVQITQILLENNRIVLEINGGGKKKRKLLEHIELGTGSQTRPIARPTFKEPPKGSFITIKFEKAVPDLTPDQVKEILANVADFSRKSATKTFVESVPEEFKEAVKSQRVEVGMDKDLVLAVLGRPLKKVRERKGEVETEDWIYGEKPQKVVFITFVENRVVSVKEY